MTVQVKREVPLWPTVIVVAAVITMLCLGLWQLQRRDEKEALIALYRKNNMISATISYPLIGPTPDSALFRRSAANCLRVTSWSSGAGRDTTGKTGIRYVAQCSTGAEGPGLIAAMGVADTPDLKPDWAGGIISGVIVNEPDRRNLLDKLIGPKIVLRPMLIADKPIAGMRAPAQPSIDDIPNNHLLYVIQWFFFAAAAMLIYLLALSKKWREQAGTSS